LGGKKKNAPKGKKKPLQYTCSSGKLAVRKDFRKKGEEITQEEKEGLYLLTGLEEKGHLLHSQGGGIRTRKAREALASKRRSGEKNAS